MQCNFYISINDNNNTCMFFRDINEDIKYIYICIPRFMYLPI